MYHPQEICVERASLISLGAVTRELLPVVDKQHVQYWNANLEGYPRDSLYSHLTMSKHGEYEWFYGSYRDCDEEAIAAICWTAGTGDLMAPIFRHYSELVGARDELLYLLDSLNPTDEEYDDRRTARERNLSRLRDLFG